MPKQLICLLAIPLLTVAAWATANPISFTSARYEIYTSAFAEDEVREHSADSPPEALPLTATSTAGIDDFAQANATADNAVLGTFAYALSDGGEAGATSVANFIGEFLAPSGLVTISLDFLTESVFSDPLASAQGALYLRIISGGIIVLEESIVASENDIVRSVLLPAGAASEIAIVLGGTAYAFGAEASASNTSSVTFAATGGGGLPIAEPGTVALLSLALAAIVFVRRGLITSSR